MKQTYYKVRVYVGPVAVDHYVEVARRAGLTGVWGGTEHVYAEVPSGPLQSEGDRLVLRQRAADLVYGAHMAAGFRDVAILS